MLPDYLYILTVVVSMFFTLTANKRITVCLDAQRQYMVIAHQARQQPAPRVAADLAVMGRRTRHILHTPLTPIPILRR